MNSEIEIPITTGRVEKRGGARKGSGPKPVSANDLGAGRKPDMELVTPEELEEFQVTTGRVLPTEPPEHLTAEQKEHWLFARFNCPPAFLANIDVDLFERYAVNRVAFIHNIRDCEEQGPYSINKDGEICQSLANKEYHRLFNQMKFILPELGFTPSARLRYGRKLMAMGAGDSGESGGSGAEKPDGFGSFGDD